MGIRLFFLLLFCTHLSGIGYAVVLIAFYVDFYYNVIIAWSLRFFFASFTNDLPWTSCNNPWNTRLCKPVSMDYISKFIRMNILDVALDWLLLFVIVFLFCYCCRCRRHCCCCFYAKHNWCLIIILYAHSLRRHQISR